MVKPVYWVQIFPLTANTVPSRGHNTTPTLNKCLFLFAVIEGWLGHSIDSFVFLMPIEHVPFSFHCFDTIYQDMLLKWMFYSKGDFPISFLNRIYAIMDRLKLPSRKFCDEVETMILFNNMDLRKCFLELEHIQCQFTCTDHTYTSSWLCHRIWSLTELRDNANEYLWRVWHADRGRFLLWILRTVPFMTCTYLLRPILQTCRDVS